MNNVVGMSKEESLLEDELDKKFVEDNRQYFREVAPDLPDKEFEQFVKIFFDSVNKDLIRFKREEAVKNLLNASDGYKIKQDLNSNEIKEDVKQEINHTKAFSKENKVQQVELDKQFVQEYRQYFYKITPDMPTQIFTIIVDKFFQKVEESPSHYISLADRAETDLLNALVRYKTQQVLELNQIMANIKAQSKAINEEDNVPEKKFNKHFVDNYRRYFHRVAPDLPDEEFEQIVKIFFYSLNKAPNNCQSKTKTAVKNLLNASKRYQIQKELKLSKIKANIKPRADQIKVISKEGNMLKSELEKNFVGHYHQYFREIAPNLPDKEFEQSVKNFFYRVNKAPSKCLKKTNLAVKHLLKASERYNSNQKLELNKIKTNIKPRSEDQTKLISKETQAPGSEDQTKLISKERQAPGIELDTKFYEDYRQHFREVAPDLPDNEFEEIVKIFFETVKENPNCHTSKAKEIMVNLVNASQIHKSKQDLKTKQTDLDVEFVEQSRFNMRQAAKNLPETEFEAIMENFLTQVKDNHIAIQKVILKQLEHAVLAHKKSIEVKKLEKGKFTKFESCNEYVQNCRLFMRGFARDLPNEEFESIMETFFDRVEHDPSNRIAIEHTTLIELEKAVLFKKRIEDAEIENRKYKQVKLDKEYVNDCRLYMRFCAQNLPDAEFESIMGTFFREIIDDQSNYIALEDATLKKLEIARLAHQTKIKDAEVEKEVNLNLEYLKDCRLFMRFYAEDLPDAEFESIMETFFCQLKENQSNYQALEDDTLKKLKVALLAHQNKIENTELEEMLAEIIDVIESEENENRTTFHGLNQQGVNSLDASHIVEDVSV